MLPSVGYLVGDNPILASYRLRVSVPAPHLGLDYKIGSYGKVSFLYKHGESVVPLAENARERGLRVVYDVVNDHFDGPHAEEYFGAIKNAHAITCASEWMARRIAERAGRQSVVVPDPYETPELEPECAGRNVLWFGHAANLSSALDAVDAVVMAGGNPRICTNVAHPQVELWTQENERRELDDCAVVLLTGNNPGASANRVLKAIRSGRFVVAQDVESWRELADFIHIGDYQQGIEWALQNRKQACEKVRAGQEWIRDRFSPEAIGAQWGKVFRSQLG